MTTPSITNFYTQSADNTSIQLTWEGIDFSSVNLYYSLTSTFSGTSSQTINASTNITNYTFTDLTSNTLYYFKIIPYSGEDGTGTAGTSFTVYETTTYTPSITSFQSKYTSNTSVPLFFTGNYYGVIVKYKKTADAEADYITVSNVVGKSLYNVTNLEANTEYDFQITPFDTNYITGTESTITNIWTDKTPYITTIEIGTITASTVELIWTGETTYITIQVSTDNVVFKDDTILYYVIDSSGEYGSCTVVNLDPRTQYYFRVIPYSENYNVGTITEVLTATTLLGFTNYYVSDITTEQIKCYWQGNYDYVDIYYSYQGSSNIMTISNPENITDTSFVLTELFEYKIYDISLVPYTFVNTNTKVEGTTVTISNIYTDFIPRVNVSVLDISDNSISVLIDRESDSYPPYKNLYIQYVAAGSGETVVNYASVTLLPTDDSLPLTYYISPLKADTCYDLSFIPTSYYDVSGTIQTYTVYTLGNIKSSSFTLSFETVDDDDHTIIIDCSGIFTNTIIRYSDSSGFETYIDISRNGYNETIEYPVSIDFSTKDLATESLYFCIYPVNQNEDIGVSTTTLYTPSISTFYMSDVSNNYITFVWNGVFEFVHLQKSTDGETYTDISTNIYDTSYTLVVSTATTEKEYYRIIPNTSYINGKNTINIYTPFIIDEYIGINSVIGNDISLNWIGIYDYVVIKYSVDGGLTYNDLSLVNEQQISNSTVNTLFINSSLIPDMDTETQSYYFSITPYYNKNTNFSFSGIVSNSVYNATINVSVSHVETNPNKLQLSITGTYEGGYIYHSETTDFSEIVSIPFSAADGGVGATNTVIIDSLKTNTEYYFKVVPYSHYYLENRSLGIPIEVSYNTQDIFDNFTISYNSSQTTDDEIVIEWNYREYTEIEITPSGEEVYIFKSSDTTDLSFSTLGLQTLIPNTIYYYNVELTDNIFDNCFITIEAATKPSVEGLNIDYTTTTTSIIFTWENTNNYYDRIVFVLYKSSEMISSSEYGNELTTNLSWEITSLETNVIYDLSARLYNALDDYVELTVSVETDA